MELGKIRRIQVREIWNLEHKDFTPWLAENIELLGKTLHIDIEPEPLTEVKIASFKADIIAVREGTDARILVENQLEETDHNHLGQLITYASGMKIGTVVWIAPKFKEEHRAAIDWLNAISESGIDFFGLQIEVLRIDDSAPAPQLNVVCRPNDWSREKRDIIRTDEPTRHARRVEYWNSLCSALRSSKGKLSGDRAPNKSNWLSWGIDKGGIVLKAYCRKDSAWIALELSGTEVQPSIGKDWFRELELQREPIEADLGFALDWDKGADRRTCWIRHELDGPGWGDGSPWHAEHATMAAKLNRMHEVFAPLVKGL